MAWPVVGKAMNRLLARVPVNEQINSDYDSSPHQRLQPDGEATIFHEPESGVVISVFGVGVFLFPTGLSILLSELSILLLSEH